MALQPARNLDSVWKKNFQAHSLQAFCKDLPLRPRSNLVSGYCGDVNISRRHHKNVSESQALEKTELSDVKFIGDAQELEINLEEVIEIWEFNQDSCMLKNKDLRCN
ncbi:hypothetical protein TNCV_3572201 [Trichonephila clavipes]|nr:hypothetical protein TNCV_3572201 [Trichonephila clavipes]